MTSTLGSSSPCMTVFLLLSLVMVLGWGIRVRNDLARRLEILKALNASVASAAARRNAVAREADRSTRRAQTHEKKVANVALRRGNGGRRGWANDLANRWPNTAAVKVAGQSMTVNEKSHDYIFRAAVELQREAETYNGLVRSFPQCIVAQLLGYTPWRFKSSKMPEGKRKRRGHGKSNQHKRRRT